MLLVCATSLAQYHHHDDRGFVCFGLDDVHSHAACSYLKDCHFHNQSHSSSCSQHLLSFYELPRTDDDNDADADFLSIIAPDLQSVPLPKDTQLFDINNLTYATPAYCDNTLLVFPVRGSPFTTPLKLA